MIIGVGTKNKAKLAACESVLKTAFGDNTLIESIDAPSGVDSMPKDNDTTFQGALNRANYVLENLPNAKYGIGLEGGVYDGPFDKMYLLGWAVIINRLGEISIGHSGGVVLPDNIANQIKKGAELGPLMHEITGNDVRRDIGTTGLLTAGMYPRDREFEDALRNAVSRFVAPEYYK
jgi:inosine/xanthosine triphosphatase